MCVLCFILTVFTFAFQFGLVICFQVGMPFKQATKVHSFEAYEWRCCQQQQQQQRIHAMPVRKKKTSRKKLVATYSIPFIFDGSNTFVHSFHDWLRRMLRFMFCSVSFGQTLIKYIIHIEDEGIQAKHTPYIHTRVHSII